MMSVSLAFSLCLVVAAGTYSCTGTVDGTSYDLSPLMGIDITGDDGKGQEYHLYMCADAPVNHGECTMGFATVCQTTDTVINSEFRTLAVSTEDPVWEASGDGISLTFSNGPVCYGAGPRKVVINLICDLGSGIPDKFVSVAEDPFCVYTMEYRTSVVCEGAAGGLSFGSILMISISVLIPLYILIGCVIKRKKMGITGVRESVPNIDFWASLPSLVKDGCAFTKTKLQGVWGKLRSVTAGSGSDSKAYDEL